MGEVQIPLVRVPCTLFPNYRGNLLFINPGKKFLMLSSPATPIISPKTPNQLSKSDNFRLQNVLRMSAFSEARNGHSVHGYYTARELKTFSQFKHAATPTYPTPLLNGNNYIF